MDELHFYIDDSGTRNPDHDPQLGQIDDWFALGGVIVRSEDEDEARSIHAAFCSAWNIDYPLHSSDIRFCSGNFEWLRALSDQERGRFFSELSDMVISAPVVGHACVVDRPGYNARYRERYGRQRWSLCKTAFSVVVERAAKLAAADGRRLRVFPERSDKKSEGKLKSYFDELRTEGMPFADGGDKKYFPLPAENLARTLREFRLKFKSSPLMQIADLYLYPICKGAYRSYRPLSLLRDRGKLVDCRLQPEDIPSLGIKYSCFELVEAGRQKSERAAE